MTLAPGISAPVESATVPDSDDVTPPWANAAGTPQARIATRRKAPANSRRTARVMNGLHCIAYAHRNARTVANQLADVEGPQDREKRNAPCDGRGPLPPSTGIQRVCDERYPVSGGTSRDKDERTAGQPTFGLRQLAGWDGACDETPGVEPPARARMLLGAQNGVADPEHVRRRRLSRIHLDEIEPVEEGRIAPCGVDQEDSPSAKTTHSHR